MKSPEQTPMLQQENFKTSNRFSSHDNRHSHAQHGIYFGNVSTRAPTCTIFEPIAAIRDQTFATWNNHLEYICFVRAVKRDFTENYWQPRLWDNTTQTRTSSPTVAASLRQITTYRPPIDSVMNLPCPGTAHLSEGFLTVTEMAQERCSHEAHHFWKLILGPNTKHLCRCWLFRKSPFRSQTVGDTVIASLWSVTRHLHSKVLCLLSNSNSRSEFLKSVQPFPSRLRVVFVFVSTREKENSCKLQSQNLCTEYAHRICSSWEGPLENYRGAHRCTTGLFASQMKAIRSFFVWLCTFHMKGSFGTNKNQTCCYCCELFVDWK